MTLFYFMLHVAMTMGTICLFLAPVGYLLVRAKRQSVSDEPVTIIQLDKTYKVNVRAAKKYLKSRGIVVV